MADGGDCIIAGCTDSRHAAYDPAATYDSGRCPPIPGCTDSAALNFVAQIFDPLVTYGLPDRPKSQHRRAKRTPAARRSLEGRQGCALCVDILSDS